MIVRSGMMALWSAAAMLLAASPAPETRVKIDTLTCRAFAAALAAFEGQRAAAPIYQALVAEAQARTGTSGNEREVSAAIDDTLVDCATQPDRLVLDLLAHHRIIGDRWRE